MFFTLVRAEWTKTMRMMSTYIAFLAALALVLIIHTGVYMTADDSEFFKWMKQNGIDTSLLVNSYIATRLSLEIGFVLLLAPMVIQVFARQVAGEDTRGTLRLVLSRPISRFSLVSAKFVVSSAYCLLLMGFTLASSFGIGLALYGPKDTITIGSFEELEGDQFRDEAKKLAQEEMAKQRSLPPEQRMDPRRMERKMTREIIFKTISKYVISPWESVRRLAIAWLLTSWALMTIGAIALLFSVVNRHPISAMALTIGLYFLVVILQEMSKADNIIPLFKTLAPYLFTNAMDYWRECMGFKTNWDKIWSKAGLLGAYTFGFFALAQWLFWRKDITS